MQSKTYSFYCVTGKLSPKTAENPKEWTVTKRWGVVASTPELAGAQVRLCWPSAVIHTISHRGTVDCFHEALEELKAQQ